MKKILSLILMITLICTLCFSVSAATGIDANTYVKDDIIDIYANQDYTVSFGVAGDGIRITSVKITGQIFDSRIKYTNSTTADPAYITVQPKYVYRNVKSAVTMTISYKEPNSNKTETFVMKFDVYPEEKDASDWEVVYTGVSYVFSGSDEINFEFDHGTFTVKPTANQKNVNLSYTGEISETILNKYPSIIDVVTFKGDHQFVSTGKLAFDTYWNGSKIYVYELTADGPVAIPYNSKDDAYVSRTRKLGTYIFTDSEIIEKIVEVVPIPEPTPIPEPMPEPTPNTNYNPNTGR